MMNEKMIADVAEPMGTNGASRRNAVRGGLLSAGALLLLSGRDAMAAKASANPAGDVAILNVALGLEHEAINAYQLGAESGLLSKDVLGVAVRFQADHKEHRDAIAATIKKLGGKPVEAMKMEEYAKSLKAGTLKSQEDVLKLASRLELGAANAYIGVCGNFSDAALSKVAARLVADETMHWTLLNSALGQPLPKGALSFGASAA